MNYNIYNKELMAVNQGLDIWRHLILGQDTTVHTDHANLTYYRKPQKLTLRAKWAVAWIMQYCIKIKHKPGVLNKANALSQHPDYPHKPEAEWEMAFPESMFINAASVDITIPAMMAAQHNHHDYFKSIAEKYSLYQNGHLWFHPSNQLIVPENNELKQGVISLFHNSTMAGHPGML
jgi:hypothetical protein